MVFGKKVDGVWDCGDGGVGGGDCAAGFVREVGAEGWVSVDDADYGVYDCGVRCRCEFDGQVAD